MRWINPYQSLKQMRRVHELEDENAKLKAEVIKLKAELWVHKDSALRTYDGMSIKAQKYDVLTKVVKDKVEHIEKFLNPIHVNEFVKDMKEFINELQQA